MSKADRDGAVAQGREGVLALLAFVVAACGAGGAGAGGASPTPTGTDREPGAGVASPGACNPAAESRVTTVPMEGGDRITVELAMQHGVAVVRYDCASLRPLPRCSVRGSYGFTGAAPAKTDVTMTNEKEVRAQLPYGALDVIDAVKRGSVAELTSVTVGQSSTGVHDAPRAILEGDCAGATHTVRAAEVGAFALQTRSHVEQNAQVAAPPLVFSASSASSTEVNRLSGERDACAAAAPTSTTPARKCRALITLVLSPIRAQ